MKQFLFTAVLAVVLALSAGLPAATEDSLETPSTDQNVQAGEADFLEFHCNDTNSDLCKEVMAETLKNDEVTEEKQTQAARPPVIDSDVQVEVWRKWRCRKATYRWAIPRSWGCSATHFYEDRCYGGCPSVDYASPNRRDYCYCCKGLYPYTQRINCLFGYIVSYRFRLCSCRTCSPRLIASPVGIKRG